MHFKRTFFVLIFLVLAQLGAAQQKELADRIIATVGENIILQSDVEIAFLQEQSKQTEKVLSPDIKCTILDNLLLEKLFLAQGALDSVVVQEEEINAELDRRVKYFTSLFGSKEKLEAYYGKSTAELKDEFTEDVKNQLLSDRVRGKVFSGLKVSPKEVKDYFNRIPKDSIPLFNEEVEIGQIVMFPKVNDEQKALSKEKLLRIKKEIEAGADFSLQAILYSDDPGSASDGGNLGIIERGELVPDFEAAAYKLNEGQMSEIVETPFGFHLIRLDEKRGDKLKLRHILIKPKITNGDVLRVEEMMDSIAHQLKVDSLTFREAVKYFSEDEDQQKYWRYDGESENRSAIIRKSRYRWKLNFHPRSNESGTIFRCFKFLYARTYRRNEKRIPHHFLEIGNCCSQSQFGARLCQNSTSGKV
jgi:peptidyl-prolyl cis-trans isomerase SurA